MGVQWSQTGVDRARWETHIGDDPDEMGDNFLVIDTNVKEAFGRSEMNGYLKTDGTYVIARYSDATLKKQMATNVRVAMTATYLRYYYVQNDGTYTVLNIWETGSPASNPEYSPMNKKTWDYSVACPAGTYNRQETRPKGHATTVNVMKTSTPTVHMPSLPSSNHKQRRSVRRPPTAKVRMWQDES